MKWIHNLLKCFSFSAVLFTFEACYGTMGDYYDYNYNFAVYVVDDDGKGINNVKIEISNPDSGEKYFVQKTRSSGMAYFKESFTSETRIENIKLSLNPSEGAEFQPKDTVIPNDYEIRKTGITITLDRK